MRKITRLAVNAFMNNDSIRLGNARVDASGMLTELYLHENKIAEKVKFTEVIRITTAGWNTNTTKERLNGIPGVCIETKKGQLYLNGKEWDGSWTTI